MDLSDEDRDIDVESDVRYSLTICYGFERFTMPGLDTICNLLIT